MRRNALLLAGGTLAAVLALAARAGAGEDSEWSKDLDGALARAKKEKKVVVVECWWTG